MATGPNQILVKRSDVSGVVPSGLSFGEPAINASDGILYFSQQTEGNSTTDYWEFKGFTNEGYVQSVNGVTGAVTTAGLVLHVAGISSDGGITVGGVIEAHAGISSAGATFSGGISVGGLISGGAGINLSAGDLEMVNGSRMGNATNGTFRVSTSELQLLPNNDTTNAFFVSSTLHKHNKITHFVEGISADGGSTFGGVIEAHAGISSAGATFSNIVNLHSSGVKFSDGTAQTTAASGSGGGGGATQSIGFILDGNGSPLTTGDKLDALKQVPFDCQILNTAAFIPDGASGPTKTIVFGVKKTSTLSSSITGTTLEIGNTGSADQIGFTFDGANGGVFFRELANVGNAAGSTIDSNDWIFPDITGNSGDIDKLQIFMTVIPT